MFKLYLTSVVLFLFMLFVSIQMVYAQNNNSHYEAFNEAEGVWRIVEDSTVNIYLVEGKDSALVIDAGYGRGELKQFIEELTILPLIVVNTHGHGDHNGADNQFAKVHIHENDIPMLINRFGENFTSKISIVKEGFTFNLGNRKIEVIEVPGHTPGSICLIDKKNKILFAGDHINKVVWLFLDVCLPLEVYLGSLQKVKEYIGEFDLIMPGHNEPFGNTFINELITCVESIIDGKCSAVSYDYSEFTKDYMLCTYKTSKVAYDPKKLFNDD